MNVVIEKNINNVKIKMTAIRRDCRTNGKGRIYNNYYNNCDRDEEIYVVYGGNTVVLWDDDDGVFRGYFYSSNEAELIKMLGYLPKDCVVEIVTRTGDEYGDIMLQAGLVFHCEMHRFVSDVSEEAKKVRRERDAMMSDIYCPERVRAATEVDSDTVYDKLHEIFNPKESHLPNKRQLLELIEKKWVSLYFEENELKALHIFKVEAAGRNYGYLTWNGAGIDAYYSVLRFAWELYQEYLEKNGIDKNKVPPGYAWADIANKKAIRGIKYGLAHFDGLIDFVYKKV